MCTVATLYNMPSEMEARGESADGNFYKPHFVCRILKAGRAVVITDWSTSYDVTHVITTNTSKDKGEKCRIPHYSVSYVAKHLFGVK